jgi:hypothetical protein
MSTIVIPIRYRLRVKQRLAIVSYAEEMASHPGARVLFDELRRCYPRTHLARFRRQSRRFCVLRGGLMLFRVEGTFHVLVLALLYGRSKMFLSGGETCLNRSRTMNRYDGYENLSSD